MVTTRFFIDPGRAAELAPHNNGNVLVQATFYRLVGAVVYLAIGHLDSLTFVSLRVIMVATYIGTLAAAPIASHAAVSYRLLGERAAGQLTDASVSDHIGFLLVYVGLIVVFAIALYRQLALQRRNVH